METRRADTIATELEEMLFDGTFSDGDRLDETKLSQQFGVSRTPLREAFQRLALSGLVELIPRRGAFVRHPGLVELIEMFEVMAELEATCGRLAARRLTDTDLTALRTANDSCRAAIAAQDPDGYYTANEHFHRLLYTFSGNGFLAQETAKLHKRLKPFRRRQLRARGRMHQSMGEHDAIVAALADANPEAAARALRDHVAVQGEKFHSLMASIKT